MNQIIFFDGSFPYNYLNENFLPYDTFKKGNASFQEKIYP